MSKETKKKRYLIVVLCVGLLCVGSGLIQFWQNGINKEKERTRQDTGQESDVTQLVVAVPYSGVPEEDMKLMEEKVNAILREKIQMEVKFVWSSHYKNMVNLMLAGGEQLDIMLASGNLFMESYINGYLLPLEQLLETDGQGILAETGEDAVRSCEINGRIYGVPNNRDYAAGTNAYMFRKDILDKYGIQTEDIRTMEDLEQVFAIVKEGEPDMTVLASGGDTMISNFYFSSLMMGGFRLGVHMDYGRDSRLVNVFRTEEYFDALKRIRRWYLRGYLDEDMPGETEDLFTRVRKGEIFAYTTKWKPGLESQDTNAAGYEMVCVQLGETAVCFNTYSSMPYTITKNTISAEKSMKLLNLLYTDADLMNLMSYGVEGVHYKKTDDGHLTYMDDTERNPFINNAWKVPNQFITDVWEGNPTDLWEKMREFNQNAIQSCDIGFNFDFTPVMTEYFTLKDIYSRYKNVLENGLVNPEEGLSSMLREMEESGLSDVMAEENRQFLAWEARN